MSFRKNQWKQNNHNDGSSGSNSGPNNNGRGQWFHNNNNSWKKRGGNNNHRNYGSPHPRRNGMIMDYGSGNQSGWYHNNSNFGVDNVPHRIDTMPPIESSSTFPQNNINQFAMRDRTMNRTYSPWKSDNFNSGRTPFYPQQFVDPDDFHGNSYDIGGFDESRSTQNLYNAQLDHTSTSSISMERSSDSSTPNHTFLQDAPSLVTNNSRSDDQYKVQEEIQTLPMNAVRPVKIRSAEEVTKKLMNQLTSMDKHNLKQIINNPNSKYDTALQSHARKKNREEVRKQLRIMSMDQETIIEPDECIDSDKIPEAVCEEIGRVVDVNLFSSSGRRSSEKLVCPDDILLRADQILMDDFLLERNDTADMRPSSISPQPPPPNLKSEQNIVSIPGDLLANSFMNMLEVEIDQDKTMPNLGNVSSLSVGFDFDGKTTTIEPSSQKKTIRNVPHSKLTSVEKPTPTTTGSDAGNRFGEISGEMCSENIKTPSKIQDKNSATVTSSIMVLGTQKISLKPVTASNHKTKGKEKSTISTTKTKELNLRQESVPHNVKPSMMEVCQILPETKKTVDLKTKLQNLTTIKSSRLALIDKSKSTHTSVTQSKTAHSSHVDNEDKSLHKKKCLVRNDGSGQNSTSIAKKRRRSASSGSRSPSSTSKKNCSTTDAHTIDDHRKKNNKNYDVPKEPRSDMSKTRSESENKKSPIGCLSRPDFVDDDLSNIYDTCIKNLGNPQTPSETCDAIDIVDDQLTDSVEKLSQIQRSESDDEECRKIIDNIESLIENELRPCTPSHIQSNSSGITLVKISDLMVPINDTGNNGNVMHDRQSIELDSKDAGASESDTEMVVAESYHICEPSYGIADSSQKISTEENIENTAIEVPNLLRKSTTDSILPESSADTTKSSGENIITKEMVEVHRKLQNNVAEVKCTTKQHSPEEEVNSPAEGIGEHDMSPKKKKKKKNKSKKADEEILSNVHREKQVTSSTTDIHLKPVKVSHSSATKSDDKSIDSTQFVKSNQPKTNDELSEVNSYALKVITTPAVENSINCNEIINSVSCKDYDKILKSTDLKSGIKIEKSNLLTSNSKDKTIAQISSEVSSSKSTHSTVDVEPKATDSEAPKSFESTSIPITTSAICPKLSPVVVITAMSSMRLEFIPSTSTSSATTDTNLKSATTSPVPSTIVSSTSTNNKASVPVSLPISTTGALPETVINEKPFATPISTKTVKEEKISVKKTVVKPASKVVTDIRNKKDSSKHKNDSSSNKNKHRHRERDREHDEHFRKKEHRSEAKSREDNARHKSVERSTALSKFSDQPRLWRSPGEKKIIEPTAHASTSENKKISSTELERPKKLKDCKDKSRNKHNETRHSNVPVAKILSSSPLTDTNSTLATSSGLLQADSTSQNEQLRSFATELPSSSGDQILNRMKEIDLKLMEYQQQKMSIDEIILKYQKDKMSIEQQTMQLQNERFQLLSSMLSTNNNANTHLMASGLTKMRSQEPITIIVPNPEVHSAIDLNKAEISNTDKTMKIKHLKSNSKKRALEIECKDVEHRSKKSKLSLKVSSQNKHGKSKKISESTSKCTVTLNLANRRICQKSKRNETVDLTIDERPTSTADNACQSNARLDAALPTFSINKYRHLIAKECRVRLKRYKRNEWIKMLSSPIPSENPISLSISSLAISNLETNFADSIKSDPTEAPEIQPKLDDNLTEADFHGFLTPNSNFDGRFVGHRMPIVFMQVIGNWLVAASEDGNIYKYNIDTGQLVGTFTHHSKTVTAFITTDMNNILSVSLDGSLRKFQLENFGVQIATFDIAEPLQVIEYCWNTAFIGSRSGKIYVYDLKIDKLNEEYMCSVGKSIMALKTAREGPRNILIVSSRTNHINVRDAQTGLLLRTIEVPDKVTIYSILLDGGIIHCGTNQNKIISYEFTSGNEIGRKNVGIGAICLRIFKGTAVMCGCYDGSIYAYDKFTGTDIHQMQGPGKMLLHFDIVNNKIICAAKDNKALRMWDMPVEITSYISAKR